MINCEFELLICFSIPLFACAQEPKDWPWNHAQKSHAMMTKEVDPKTKLAIVVVHNNKVYQRNQWSRDNEDEIDRLEGKVGDEITVGCQIYHEDGLVPILEDTMIGVRIIGSSYKFGESCKGKLVCWFNFTLTETVFLTCLGQGSGGQALFYRVRIDPIQPTTTSPPITPVRVMTMATGQVAGSRPHIFKIGPHVVRKTGQQVVLFNPQWSLKQVEVHLQVNLADVQPKCLPYVETAQKGWTAWLKSRTNQRQRRDTTGILGTGLGVLNSINSEVIMNKLATATQDLNQLQQPLHSSLLTLGNHQWLTSKLLPDWERTNIKDHSLILEGMKTLQKDTSLALSCIQAQMWVQSIISNILREGEEGILPTEVRKVIWDKALHQERELQSWWKLVNFTYDSTTDKIIAFVLTIPKATQYKIYPITAIGLYQHGVVINPVGHKGWAWQHKGKWQTINTDLCTNMGHQGYICEGNTMEAQDICLDTHQKECNFKAQPSPNNHTVLIYIGEGCICLRTSCKSLIVDNYEEEIGGYSNYCICNFTKAEGCDFTYTIPVLSSQVIKTEQNLFQKIDSIPIGMNLERVKEMLQHEDLLSILEEVKKKGKEMLVVDGHRRPLGSLTQYFIQ
ncbi:uncharacterized protein LOC141917847 [Strix aluco]|uniref:uncharacterized protein LOC141917847 n=1 Tax=Strix aluco TaxID=111821 RepID=UPI003DA20CB4